MADNTVVIFNLETQKPERHTRANARDFVNSGSHTWHAGRPSTPASIAPFAVFKAPEGSITQDVLNKATGQSGDGKSGAAASAQAQLESQLAAQQAQFLADQQAAALAAANVPVEEVADFSAPVEAAADEVDDAALEAAAEADAESQATPTTRRRRNSNS